MSSEDIALTGASDSGQPSEDARDNTSISASRSIMTPAISEFHEAANLFPLMDEATLTELAADIAANGLHEPIWRHKDGRIIDGRNRWRACAKAGVECRHRTYPKDDDTIVPFVVSRNLHRRHLTTAQRAAVAADIANLGRGQRADRVDTAIAVSQPEAAKLMKVSVDSLQRAASVKRADPVLHEKVKTGEITAAKARAAAADVIKAAGRASGKKVSDEALAVIKGTSLENRRYISKLKKLNLTEQVNTAKKDLKVEQRKERRQELEEEKREQARVNEGRATEDAVAFLEARLGDEMPKFREILKQASSHYFYQAITNPNGRWRDSRPGFNRAAPPEPEGEV